MRLLTRTQSPAAKDVRVIGLQVVIHQQCAVLCHFQAGVHEKIGIRADAERQDNRVGLHGTVFGADFLYFAIAFDGDQPVAGKNRDAFVAKLIFSPFREILVKAGHDLICHIDDDRPHTLQFEVFGNFEPDEAAARRQRHA